MKLVVGLGNPGKKYEKTRHNVGFDILDKIATTQKTKFKENTKLKALISEIMVSDSKALLVKPTTFMNSSGEAVGLITNFYKIPNEDVLIIHDEVDLVFGKTKLSHNSRPAGHNGIKSIIASIGKDITRLRIGIDGRKDRSEVPTEKYVLDKFTLEELKQLEADIIPEAMEKMREWFQEK